jgi:DNA polymerase-1
MPLNCVPSVVVSKMYKYAIPDTSKRIELIDTEREVDRAIRHLLRWDTLGFDVETYHSVDHTIPAFKPQDGARMRLAQFATPKGRSFVFDLFKIDKRFMYRLFPNNFLCVTQNGKFELTFLMYELGLFKYGHLWDTMLAEQVLAKGFVAADAEGYVPVGLDDVAQRHLGIFLPKDEQASDWYKEVLTDKQIEYAARDAQVVLPIFQHQAVALKQQGQIRVAELEFDALPANAFMELSGVRMDKEEWVKRCDQKTLELDAIKKELYPLLDFKGQGDMFDTGREPLNLNSGPDVIYALEKIGVKIPIDPKDPEKKKKTLAAKLFESQMHIPAVKLFTQYVKLNKALTSYGYKWLDKVDPYDGRIHTHIKQIGAETGRMSSPDMLVIPKDDMTRNCFIADPGWVLIDADYSQCELRILAEYSRDPNLLLAFDKGYDLHRFSAHLIYKIPMEEVSGEQRGVAKNLNFGIVYGIGAKKFGNDAKIGEDEGQRIMDYYLKEAYPGMGAWLDGRARMVLHQMYATTMTGRVRQYRGNLNDREFKGKVQRNAKNLPIQGTNADITKRAMALVYQEIVNRDLQGHIKMLLVVHDELLLEARPWLVDVAQDILTRNMLKAEREYLRRVPAVVDCNVMLKWSKEPSDELIKEAQDLISQYQQYPLDYRGKNYETSVPNYI